MKGRRSAEAGVLAGIVALGACAVAATGPEDASPVDAAPKAVTATVQIQRVRILSLPSYPVRVQLVVEGKMAQGGELEIRQKRKDNTVVVTLTQSPAPSEKAPRVAFTRRIVLEGGFPPGKYTLEVNDYKTTFEP